MTSTFYSLPPLAYDYDGLEPVISKQQLTLHHTKHHNAYVEGANSILKKLDELRSSDSEHDVKAMAKELSFHIGGHVLHSLFWANLSPDGKPPSDYVDKFIKDQFGSFEKFEQEFSRAAVSVEGSGWAVLVYDAKTDRLIIGQIEKHNLNLYPDCKIIIALDVWEHAYYLDYKNERAKFVAGFWKIINWSEIERRLKEVK